MHILHVIDTTGPGGAETVFIELADKLRQLGYRSSVLIRGSGWVEDELKRRNLDVYILDAKGSVNFAYLKDMVKLVRSLKVDLIQSHLLGSNLYCSLLAFLTRKPLVATFHGMVDVSSQEKFLSAKFMIMNAFANRFVMVSQQMKDMFVDSYRLSQGKSQVIYNGIATSEYQLPKNQRLKQELGLEDDVVLVGSLGNVRTAKAYHVLIAAAAECRKSDKKFAFVIAGDRKSSLMKGLNKQIEEQNLTSNIHFIGFVDNTAEYLSNLDIFLLCSSSEGFSISTIEAMSASLPVIATRCGGPEEILENGITGYLVENGNALAIADKLQAIVENPEKASALAQHGKQHACTAFDIEAMLKQYLKVYDELI